MEESVAIPLSKRKLWILLLLCCAFVAGGYWLWGKAHTYGTVDSWRARSGAVACMAFFGLGAPILAYKAFDRRAGLVIDTNGIYRMGLWSYQLPIRWEHITHLTTREFKGTKFLLIHVDNVEQELARLSPVARWFQRIAISSNGTPFSLSSAALQVDFSELEDLINAGISRHRQHNRT